MYNVKKMTILKIISISNNQDRKKQENKKVSTCQIAARVFQENRFKTYGSARMSAKRHTASKNSTNVACS
jgi:hypothetical protein